MGAPSKRQMHDRTIRAHMFRQTYDYNYFHINPSGYMLSCRAHSGGAGALADDRTCLEHLIRQGDLEIVSGTLADWEHARYRLPAAVFEKRRARLAQHATKAHV